MAKEKTRTLKWLVYAAGVVLIVADFFIERHHPYFPWDHVPGFNAAYGIGAVLVIIFFARALGGLFIQQREDYYDWD